ncbi:MAG: PQQ-binding-like beta-propeller repeat protein [Muribaculaceae bacterium]|nr:PQQ-binding-like beta-propeller repeat protein [Muribaculaceae bacterium]
MNKITLIKALFLNAFMLVAMTASANGQSHVMSPQTSLNRQLMSRFDMSQRGTSMMAPAMSEEGEQISLLWNEVLDMPNGESDCMESRSLRLADGSYVGIYNNGAGRKFYQGAILKIDSKGEILWETTIDMGPYTTADQLATDGNGNCFVAGTALVDGRTVAYVACYDDEGALSYSKMLDKDMKMATVAFVGSYEGKAVVAYSVYDSPYESMTLYCETFDGAGEVVQTVKTTGSDTYMQCAQNGEFVMVNSLFNLSIINVKEGTVAYEDSGWTNMYQDAAAMDNAIYLVYRNSNYKAAVMKFEIADGAIQKAWDKETKHEYQNYNLYVFPLSSGKVLTVVKGETATDYSLLDDSGNILYEKSKVSFDNDNAEKNGASAFIYSAGQTADGDIWTFGHAYNFQLVVGHFKEDLTPVGVSIFTPDNSYPYWYSYNSESYFDDGQFVVTGFVRPEEYYDHGHTAFFSTVDPVTCQSAWVDFRAPGAIPTVQPYGLVADKEGNSYVASLDYTHKLLVKNDSEGNVLWSAMYSAESNWMFAPTLLENGNVVLGGTLDGVGIHFIAYSADGTQLWKQEEKESSMFKSISNPIMLAVENKVYAFVTCGISETQTKLYCVVLNENGVIEHATAIDCFEGETSTVINNAILNDGSLYVMGATNNNSETQVPFMAQLDLSLNVVKTFRAEASENTAIYNACVDASGNVFAIANTYQNAALYVFDKDANLLAQDNNKEVVAYNSVALASDGNALVGATMQSSKTYRIEGRVYKYNLQAEKIMEAVQASDAAYCYIFNAAEIQGQYVALGYFYDWAQGMADWAGVFGADGSKEAEVTAPNYYTYYYNTFDGFFNDKGYICSYHDMGSSIKVGELSCFAVTGHSGINTVSGNDGDVKSVEYFDLMGRKTANAEGFLIERITYSNGETRSSKILKK